MEGLNGNGEYKLGVESRLTGLEVIVNEIRKNHLPHLQVAVDRIQWLLVTTLVSVVTGVIILLIKG